MSHPLKIFCNAPWLGLGLRPGDGEFLLVDSMSASVPGGIAKRFGEVPA